MRFIKKEDGNIGFSEDTSIVIIQIILFTIDLTYIIF